jgi:hypothetical protein
MTPASTLSRPLDCTSVVALSAFESTFGLLVTFGGIGLVANALIVYIVAQVIGERAENRRAAESEESTTAL